MKDELISYVAKRGLAMAVISALSDGNLRGYSRISLNGHSKKGTLYLIPLHNGPNLIPNFIPPINIMRLESFKEDNLYTGDKPLEFILVPKCLLFRDSTVL